VIVDDIPVARRSKPPKRPQSRLSALIRLSSLGLLLSLLGLALIFPGPLRRLLASPPVTGIADRPGPNGRLLGHFPYPELNRAELVTVAPGQQLQRDAADALLAMQNAALADGVDLVVLSGFRSVAEQKALLVDCREPDEWKDGHVVGAVSLPLSTLEQGVPPEQLARILPKDKIVYVHCLAGGRCLAAAKILQKSGYDVRPLKPGYPDLTRAGLPTVVGP
jgi:rhodanese-related sulfurtransferase